MAKIFACGDVVNYQNTDGLVCAPDIEAIVQAADYSICNFEAPVIGFGSPQPKCGPHLAQPVSTVTGLKQQGFDLLLLANNHMLDYGKDGLVATLSSASSAGVEALGAGVDENSAYAPLIKKIGDITLGIINGCEAQFGVIDHFSRDEKAGYAWINHTKIDTTIIALKKECDFIIVCAHAGLENYSIPQKEWRIRYRHLCDLGADVVIGSHPHVPQGYERHNASLIFYSLGNFYFDYGYAANYQNHSYAVMLDLVKGKEPGFEAVHHITKNKKVQLADSKVDLKKLCEFLGEKYQSMHDEMIIKAFHSVEGNLLRALAPIPIGKNLRATIKELAAKALGRRRNVNKDLLALHLLRNEAYYYVARNAFELKSSCEVKHK